MNYNKGELVSGAASAAELEEMLWLKGNLAPEKEVVLQTTQKHGEHAGP
jgi:hypothetical protein